MKRLTLVCPGGDIWLLDSNGKPYSLVTSDEDRYNEIKKLAEYEELEEQGKLLKLPAAVGDVVYADSGVFGILEYEVDNIVIGKTITYQCSAYSKPIGDCPSECLDEIEPDILDFGKTVFPTREEAETAFSKTTEEARR